MSTVKRKKIEMLITVDHQEMLNAIRRRLEIEAKRGHDTDWIAREIANDVMRLSDSQRHLAGILACSCGKVGCTEIGEIKSGERPIPSSIGRDGKAWP